MYTHTHTAKCVCNFFFTRFSFVRLLFSLSSSFIIQTRGPCQCAWKELCDIHCTQCKFVHIAHCWVYYTRFYLHAYWISFDYHMKHVFVCVRAQVKKRMRVYRNTNSNCTEICNVFNMFSSMLRITLIRLTSSSS